MKHWFSDVPSFRRNQLQFFLDKAAESNEPAVRLRLGSKRLWLITGPDLARTILKGEDRIADKGFFIEKLRPIVGKSLLTINGEENTRRRRAIHAGFSKGAAQQLVPEIAATVREAAVELAKQDHFNVQDAMAQLTLRIACVALFGKGVLTRGDENLVINAVRLVEEDVATELFRVVPAMPWQARAKQKRRAEARAMMQIVVNRVRDKAKDSSALRALIDLGLDDEAIRDEIVTMLIAGHHTTGAAATWILYYMASLPELSNIMAEEAARLASCSGEFNNEALLSATKSQALVKEVLRLFPSAHWFSRDALMPLSAGSNTIKTGDSMIICPWQMHRDERHWPLASTFDTNRNFSSKAYLPFGAGPRACLGLVLANMTLQVIALELASAFEFEVHGALPTPIPTGSVTLIPPTLVLRAHVRKPSSFALAAE